MIICLIAVSCTRARVVLEHRAGTARAHLEPASSTACSPSQSRTSAAECTRAPDLSVASAWNATSTSSATRRYPKTLATGYVGFGPRPLPLELFFFASMDCCTNKGMILLIVISYKILMTSDCLTNAIRFLSFFVLTLITPTGLL